MTPAPKIEHVETDCLLSVVVPVARKRPGLKRCLTSVAKSLAQLPTQDFELVVKDSTQGGLSKAERGFNGVDAIDAKSRYVHDCPRTMADSWNECVRLARGEYIHILHDDDWVRPEFYPAILSHIQNGYSAVCTGYEVEGPDGLVIFENRVCRDGRPLSFSRLIEGNPLVPSCVVVARSEYERHGGYRDDCCHDWDFYLRLRRFQVVPELLVRQVQAGDNEGAREGAVNRYRMLLKTIRDHEDGDGTYPVRFPARDTYFRLALDEAIRTRDAELFKLACEIRG